MPPSPTATLRASAATWPPSPATRRSGSASSSAATPTATAAWPATPEPERPPGPDSPLRPGAGLADPGHLAFGVALGQGLALVVGALAPGKAQLDLDQVALEVDAQGDQ